MHFIEYCSNQIGSMLSHFPLPYGIETKQVNELPWSALKSCIIEKFEHCLEQIIEHEKFEGIFYYHSQENHRVFCFSEFPNLIFKFNTSDQLPSVQKQLECIEKGQTVCKAHDLELLTIPKADIISVFLDGKYYDILMMEKLDLYPHSDGYSRLNQEQLSAIVTQLATFILNTGFSDVESRNLPLCKRNISLWEELDTQENARKGYKIGLVDIEEMNSVYIGLFGGIKKTGLIGLFSESVRKDINMAIENHFKKHKIDVIQFGYKEIKFNSFPKSQNKLREIAQNLHQDIIMKSRLEYLMDTKEKININHFFVQANHGTYEGVNKLNFDTNRKEMSSKSDQEYDDATLIGIVVNKFIKRKIVSGVSSRNGHGWTLELPSIDY